MTTNRFASSLVALLLACGPMACGASDSAGEQEGIGADSQADTGTSTPVVVVPTLADTSVSVRNGVTLTMKTELVWRGTSPSKVLVLHGSTSQDLVSVSGFIPDDGFGTPAQIGPRTFELTYDNASDIDTILSGERFFIEFETSTVSGDHSFAAMFTVQPALIVGAGTTRLQMGSAIIPYVVSDNPEGIHYRGTVTTTAVPQTLSVTAAVNPVLTQDAPHAWHFDWHFSDFETSAQSSTPVEAKGKFGATTSTRDGTVSIRLNDVELAEYGGSPDDVWGFPECDPSVAACVAALPAGTVDYSPCGDFAAVSICVF